MKAIKNIIYLIFFTSTTYSCKKTTTAPGTAAFTIVNAVVGSPNLITNFQGYVGNKTTDSLTYYNSALSIGYAGFTEISSYSGKFPLSLVSVNDTFDWIWNGSLNLSINNVYSLFLSGTDTLHVDTLFTTDVLLYHSASDSSIGIRFVNLSAGSLQVSVDIKDTSANGIEIVSSLSYQGINNFTNYPATSSVSKYVFEFRDIATNTVLATYTMNGVNNGSGSNTSNNIYRYRNFTIALIGLPGAQNTMLINNY